MTKEFNIMIVDDNRVNLEMMNMYLQNLRKINKWNIEVFAFTDGERALNAIKLVGNDKFNMIITDISMPNVNGIELATKIKEKKYNIPVIFASSLINEYITEVKELGSGILETPYNKNQIEAVLKPYFK